MIIKREIPSYRLCFKLDRHLHARRADGTVQIKCHEVADFDIVDIYLRSWIVHLT